MWPRITIVVPSYNQAPYLAEALGSLVQQRYPNLEVIVMDGGSTDASKSVIRQFADHIDYWQSKPDGGQAAALDMGFKRATGDALGWLNSDDVLLPGALARVAQEFRTDPDCAWLYGNSHVLDEAGRLLWRRAVPQVSHWQLAHLSVYLPQESTFFRRDLYELAGGVDPDLHYAMDYDLWLKLMQLAPAKHVDAFLGCFRFVSGQKSADALGYRTEEQAVKARLGHQPPPFWLRHLGTAGYRVRSVVYRIKVEGWQAPRMLLSVQMKALRGRTHSLGPSKVTATASLMGALLAVSVSAVVLLRALRHAFR